MVIQRFRPDFSGQGIQMEQLCQALARDQVQPVVLSATRGRASAWEDCDGYRIRRLRSDVLPGSAERSYLWMPTFGVRVLLELLRLDHVDVVHMHGLNDGIYGAFAFCRLRAKPLVFEMTLMGVDDPSTVSASSHLLSRLRRRIYRSCDAYVAMSRAFLPSYQEAGMPRELLHVIPQGVDTRRFRPLTPEARADVRREIGCGLTTPLVVFVGSLIARKGLDILLAAWQQIHDEYPTAHLLLVGPNDFDAASDDRRFLDEQFTRLSSGARGAVHRLGMRDDPERLLAAADIFAFPSRREGFGSAIIEAMACGLPSVVARLDGITDFLFSNPLAGHRQPLEGDADGIVVAQDDPDGLAVAVRALLSRPEWAAAVGAAGLRTAHARFDFSRVVAPAYERLYAGLATSRRA
jgi:glycosyltransferase involved in cell wall biosynthesis